MLETSTLAASRPIDATEQPVAAQDSAPAAPPRPGEHPTVPFRFVSLGSDCQPAHQISRVQTTNTSGVFDSVTTQIRHLTRLIENDFAGFMDMANMFPVYHEHIFSGAVDTLYRVGFNHDFGKLEDQDLAHVSNVYNMRIRWFRNLFDPKRPPPYFIRRYHPRDGREDESQAIALFELLRTKRRDIRFLYLHNDPSRRELMMDGYRSAFLRQRDPFVWFGDDAAWDPILSYFAVRPFAGDRQAFQLPELKRPRFG